MGNRRKTKGHAKDAMGTFKRLLAFVLARYKVICLVIVISTIVSSITSVAGTSLMQRLIDDFVTPLLLSASSDFSGLAQVLMKMGTFYGISVLSAFLFRWLLVTVSQGVLRDIRNAMFSHMQTLPIRYFDTHAFGDVMSHYTNDTDTMRELLTQGIPQLLSGVFMVSSILIAMFLLSPPLTLVVLVFMVIKLAFAGNIGGKSGHYFVEQQKALGDLDGYIEEMVNGQKVVKVFNREHRAKLDFDRKNQRLKDNAAAANNLANILMPIMANLGHLLYVVVAMVGGAMAIAGNAGLTVGVVISFLQLCRTLNMPLNAAAQQVGAIARAMAGAERIFELLDQEPEQDQGFVTLVNAYVDEKGDIHETDKRTDTWAWRQPGTDGKPVYTLLQGDVRFASVDFSYDGEKQVLSDISLFAKPGQKIAFVGSTGAGKTTITNLLTRFYDIADGKVRYDGININNIRKGDLRRSLGMVLQEVNLFTGTVMENIRYGRLDATDEEVIKAAKQANAHDFISLLPNGYQTVLAGDGSSLSQGQRQLISIARAAVADPPVMILDEATSSIDTRTESIVQSGMDSLMEGRTVFVIAHRLSTVRNSKAILVLENGRIIERGNHEELMEMKGKYYLFYTGAFELE